MNTRQKLNAQRPAVQQAAGAAPKREIGHFDAKGDYILCSGWEEWVLGAKAANKLKVVKG